MRTEYKATILGGIFVLAAAFIPYLNRPTLHAERAPLDNTPSIEDTAKIETTWEGELNLLDNFSMCTHSFGAIGLEYNPQLRDYLDIMVITGDLSGRIGAGCRQTDQTGRLSIGKMTIGHTKSTRVAVVAEFRVRVDYPQCPPPRRVEDGWSTIKISWVFDRSKYGTSYVDRITDINGNEIQQEEIASTLLSSTPCIAYADPQGKAWEGIFYYCSQDVHFPSYTIVATKLTVTAA